MNFEYLWGGTSQNIFSAPARDESSQPTIHLLDPRSAYKTIRAEGNHRKRVWSSGYDARLTRERSRVRSPLLVAFLPTEFILDFYFLGM